METPSVQEMKKLDAMDLTMSDINALRLLITCKSLVGLGHFGDLLWPHRYHGSTCSAPFARAAGKVLHRLKSAGLAEWRHEGEDWGWEATRAGRRLLENDPGLRQQSDPGVRQLRRELHERDR
jgi:hypothetical protein